MCEYALESKITLQVTQHLQLQIHRSIQNPTKYLKWYKKERLAIINYSLELFPKDTRKNLTGM